MPVLHRAALAAVSAALLAAAPLSAIPAFAAASVPVAAPTPTAALATGPKVVIVVGAVETVTSSFRADADSIYAEAIKYTSNVVKVYSPNATWDAVKAAGEGASIFIYLGHGYGFPSPYKTVLTPTVHDGMGLNEFPNQGDADKKYYGESVVAGNIRFAKNAIVILDHNCYAAGSSESGMAEPTIPVAKQRVDNFASGYLRAGARAVMADAADGNVIAMIRSIFTTHQTIGDAWHNQAWANHNDIAWQPLRNPAYTADMDPDTATTGFHRSLVGNFGMTTDDILAGAATTQAAATAPALWSLDGQTTISPNFDGDHDSLSLVGRFSEPVSWKATVTDPGGATVRTVTGSGDIAPISWTPLSAGAPLPAGDYGLTIHGVDAASQAVDATRVVHVVSLPTPPTGVLAFSPAVTSTTSSTVQYSLTFAGPVTGLTAADFTITGSSAGCALTAPVGAGTAWAVSVTSCGTGRVQVQLEPRTVTDGTTAGPVGLIAARSVTIDRSLPTVSALRISLDAGTVSGSTLRATVTWTGSDSGSGIATYDVARSLDGAAFAIVATAVTTASYAVATTSGHTYRFEVRAHDKAGNVGSWVAAATWYPSLVQQTSTAVTWTGSWTAVTSTSYSGGSARQAVTAGDSATFAFTGRALAIVLARCATCGQVQVLVDGVLASTIDTAASADSFRWIAYRQTFSSSAAHTVQLIVVGAVGDPTVTVDAFEVVR